jgi:anaphase-promoting complex subunit 4
LLNYAGGESALIYNTGPADDIFDDMTWANIVITEENISDYSRHHFSADDGFIPEKIEVNGRKGRRVVCVLGADRLHYKMFDLDSVADIVAETEEEDGDETFMSQ